MEIDDVPTEENDKYEFKSSLTTDNQLKSKIQAAASGFSNSGGGFFVIGLDDNTGLADGGISEQVGRQTREDWIDTVVNQVEQAPIYQVHRINNINGRGTLDQNKHIYVIEYFDSPLAPHMSPDQKYYIRAGAHTVPARNFILEALWAKRNVGTPKLVHAVRQRPDEVGVIQLGVIATNNDVALNVRVSVDPLGEEFSGTEEHWPLKISLIDRSNPVFFDYMTFSDLENDTEIEISIIIEYSDISGNTYTHSELVKIASAFGPVRISVEKTNKQITALNKISTEIGKLNKSKKQVKQATKSPESVVGKIRQWFCARCCSSK